MAELQNRSGSSPVSALAGGSTGPCESVEPAHVAAGYLRPMPVDVSAGLHDDWLNWRPRPQGCSDEVVGPPARKALMPTADWQKKQRLSDWQPSDDRFGRRARAALRVLLPVGKHHFRKPRPADAHLSVPTLPETFCPSVNDSDATDSVDWTSHGPAVVRLRSICFAMRPVEGLRCGLRKRSCRLSRKS